MHERGHGGDLADEEAREVDHVGAEVAERARARRRRRRSATCRARVVAPVLQVAAAEVPDLAELAGLDHLAREPHRRDEPVVERAEVLDARRRDPLPDVVALVGVAPERLLAEDVLACLGRGDRRLGVERVRAAVVEEADRRDRRRCPASRSSSARTRSAEPRRRRPARPGRRSRRAAAAAAAARPCTRAS